MPASESSKARKTGCLEIVVVIGFVPLGVDASERLDEMPMERFLELRGDRTPKNDDDSDGPSHDQRDSQALRHRHRHGLSIKPLECHESSIADV